MVFALGRGRAEVGFELERRAPRMAATGEGMVAASLDPRAVALARRRGAGFGYLFPPVGAVPSDPDDDHRLAALAEAMANPDYPGAGVIPSGSVPLGPVWTVFLRIVAHDLTALVDAAPRRLNDAHVARGAAETEAALVNLRHGVLRLASLYEPDAGPGPVADHLARVMREPGAAARLRLDRPEGPAAMGGADLPRLARMADPELRAALDASRRTGGGQGWSLDKAPGRSAAVIGDRRNDADLGVSQMTVAMIRFHNRVADWLADAGATPAERLFDRTRQLVTWHVQWLALNVWLPRICDGDTLARVRRAGAPVFRRMVERRRRAGATDGALPSPLESWGAAAKLRYSLERARYDINPGQLRAPAEILRQSGGGWLDGGRLPADRAVDWALWMDGPASGPDAVALDTRISPEPGFAQPQAARALRILRRGRAMNLPSAQDCIAGFATIYSDLASVLPHEVLCGGHTGHALRDGLAERTPLWFYVLREAETLGRGERLGPLGSALMAEAVIGALACDPGSVWNRPGRGGGRWSPDMGARPDGITVDSLEAFFAAGAGA